MTDPTPAVAAAAAHRGGAPAVVLRTRDLTVDYGSARALFGISLEVVEGTVLALLGANGAGKSTLARAVSGLVPVASGAVEFAGHEVTGRPAHRIRRAGMIHLPEGRGVFPGLTVHDNLRMAVQVLPGRRERAEAIERALGLFPALADRRRQPAGTLSGGEQQMLSLARALAAPPRLLIADEMSLGLAPSLVDQVFDGLARARAAGVAIILIEQFVHRALELADTCAVLRQGRCVWSGPAAAAHGEVLRHYLGEAADEPAGER